MKEYEYNFKVNDLTPYINYCKENGYKEEIINQVRIVYESLDEKHLIARLTKNNNKETLFDFKRVNSENKDLKVSEESVPIKVDINNINEIRKLLKLFNFKQKSRLVRTRYIYTKDDIKFEIDDYSEPPSKVVAIEGNKAKVDKLYKEIKLLDLH